MPFKKALRISGALALYTDKYRFGMKDDGLTCKNNLFCMCAEKKVS